MRKYLVILSLYLIPVFSCQGNNVVEPVKSIVPTPNQTIINVTPSPSIISSPSVLLTSSPTLLPSEIPKSLDQAKIDYPDDYNQYETFDGIYSNTPVPDEIKNDPSSMIHKVGRVFDRNNNPVTNADITISSPIARNKFESEHFYSFYYQTKTDKNGRYYFTIYDLLIKINIFTSKLGFTIRKKNAIPNSIAESGGTVNYYFGGILNSENLQSEYLSINNEPEITKIAINKQQVKKYDVHKVSLEEIRAGDRFIVYQRNLSQYLVNINTDLSRFKIKSIDKLEIEINFNKPIVKDSLENSIEIKSLDGIDIYNKSTKNISFNWSNNNSKLSLEIPIKKYSADKKYRLGFKNPFTDTEGHQAYKGMYISLTTLTFESDQNELSENIVFSIAGN